MPTDHALIDQRVQIGKETTRGTPVAAGISLPTARIMLKDEGTFKSIYPSGAMFPSASRIGKRWGSGTYEGDGSYTEMGWFLNGLLGYATASTVGTTGKRRTWDVPSRGVPTPTPFTLQQGDATLAREMAGAVITSFKFKDDPDDVSFSGDILGAKLDRAATLTATPTELPLVLIDPNEVEIRLVQTAYADLAASTALPRAAEFTLDITDLYNAFFMIGNNSLGYTGIVGKQPGATVTLTLGADDEGADLLTSLDAGTTVWIEYLATGAEYESTHAYTFKMEMALQCSKVPDDTDKDELALLKYEFVPVWDATWGHTLLITLDNASAY